MVGIRRERYKLVLSGHKLLLRIHDTDAQLSEALEEFIDAVSICRCPSSELEAILARILVGMACRDRIPRHDMLARFFAAPTPRAAPVSRFVECARRLLSPPRPDDALVRGAIAAIDARWPDPAFRAASIARELSALPSELADRFRSYTGCTCTVFLRNRRIEHAARALSDSEMRIKEIWVSCGYNDAATFNHHFRQRYGLSPGKFRKLHRCTNDCDEPPCKFPGARVLIIDDDDVTRKTLCRLLRLSGHVVEAVSTASDGLQTAARCAPEVAVVDYHLDDMDGLQFLHQVLAVAPNVRGIVFTADWDVEEREPEITALGARLLSKLCDPEDVDRTVRSLIAERSCRAG